MINYENFQICKLFILHSAQLNKLLFFGQRLILFGFEDDVNSVKDKINHLTPNTIVIVYYIITLNFVFI